MMTLDQPAHPPARPAGRTIGLTVFGGALLVGALVGALDARLPGMPADLATTAMLAIGYVACIVAVVRAGLRAFPRVHALSEFLALTPDQFEMAVGDLLSQAGFRQMRLVGGPGDLGADLLCRDASGRPVVVQCKRYAPEKRVGSQAVQTFIGMVAIHHRAHRGIFVTTSEFTTPAIELAREHGLLLIDGQALVALAQGVATGGAYQQAMEEEFAKA